jgi:hypothetical protein
MADLPDFKGALLVLLGGLQTAWFVDAVAPPDAGQYRSGVPCPSPSPREGGDGA